MIHIEKRVIALVGLPLSGKTSLGKELSHQTDAVFLDVDEARQEIAPGGEWLGPNQEREIMLEAYKRNHERALAVLRTGKAAILAATYSRPVYHEMLRDLASGEGVSLSVFLLEPSDRSVTKRLKARQVEGSNSNITSMEGYLEVKGRYQPPAESSVLDASKPIGEMAELVLQTLESSS